MKVFSIKKEYILIILYVLIIMVGLVQNYNKKTVSAFSMPESNKVITIDVGHGGWDPGKVDSSGNAIEKEINLKIATKLKAYLEQAGATVVMTRESDTALGDTKNADLRRRKEIINKSGSDLLISIHQNSYPEESISGAQTFYYNSSTKSEKLAKTIQNQIVTMDPTNKRSASANSNYYILKQTDTPAVIVECGFLSNSEEKRNLLDETYQEKMAWAIYSGIIDYYS